MSILWSWPITAKENDDDLFPPGPKDPNNKKIVYHEQLPSLAELSGTAEWHDTIYRQSGNVHSAMVVRGTASAALQSAMSTMRRAKIDSIAIQVNEEGRLKFNRLYHNHRGRNEGRKVGGAEIKRDRSALTRHLHAEPGPEAAGVHRVFGAGDLSGFEIEVPWNANCLDRQNSGVLRNL